VPFLVHRRDRRELVEVHASEQVGVGPRVVRLAPGGSAPAVAEHREADAARFAERGSDARPVAADAILVAGILDREPADGERALDPLRGSVAGELRAQARELDALRPDGVDVEPIPFVERRRADPRPARAPRGSSRPHPRTRRPTAPGDAEVLPLFSSS
jgi:hypothetical protein